MAERGSGVGTGDVASRDMRTRPPYRLAVLSSHPIQYFTPLYRRIAGEPDIDLMVYFCSRVGLEDYVDEGFGRRLRWDVPLLEGYPHRFLPNMGSGRSVSTFRSLINPAILAELWRERPDAIKRGVIARIPPAFAQLREAAE